MFLSVIFFFFKQKTAYEMRISDWSSDIVSSMALSVIVALVLTPALCATILKPHDPRQGQGQGPLARFFRWFNDKFDRGTEKYEKRSEEHTSELQSLMRISYAVLCLKQKNNPNYHYTSYATSSDE